MLVNEQKNSNQSSLVMGPIAFQSISKLTYLVFCSKASGRFYF